MLEKLNTYGIRGPAHQWFKSYLGNRQQFTVFNSCKSRQKSVCSGVPQGSILGPLLFLIYINDITRCSTVLNFLLYADDTTIFIQGKDLTVMENIINEELMHLSNWVIHNRLRFNVDKTCFMISHPLMTNIAHDINIKVNNISLRQVEELKFLGVTIDNKLIWKSHIYDLCTKISKLTGVLYKIRNCITTPCLKQIYLALAHQYLLYCSAIWGGAFKIHIDKLFIAQKKLLRIIFFKSKYDHTNPLFHDHKILKLPDTLFLQACLFVFKSLHVFPVNNGFQLTTTEGTSRRPLCLRIPLCRTSHAQQNISTTGVRYWNSLPQEIREATSLSSFKHLAKQFLFHSYTLDL